MKIKSTLFAMTIVFSTVNVISLEAATPKDWNFTVDTAIKGGLPSISGETKGDAKGLDYEIVKCLKDGTTQPLTKASLPPAKSMKLEMPSVDKETFMKVYITEQGTTEPIFEWSTFVVPNGTDIMKHKPAADYAKPKDFKEFWDKAKKELAQVQGQPVMTRIPEKDTETGMFWRVDVPSVAETTVSAWYYVPKDAFDADGKVVKKYPALQIMPGYGAEEPPFDRTKEGLITLSVNPRNHGPSRDFWVSPVDHMWYNIDQPESYYYKLAFMDGLRFIHFLFDQPEVDAKRVATEGGSQGGLFAIAVAALEPRIAAVCSNVTAFSSYADGMTMARIGHHTNFAKVFREEKDAAKLKVRKRSLAMTDGANLATMVKCPTQINMGDIDPVCPYVAGIGVLNSLASKNKEFHIYANTPHAVPNEMRANNAAWLKKYIKLGTATPVKKTDVKVTAKKDKAKSQAKKNNAKAKTTKKAKKKAVPTPCPCEKYRLGEE